MDFDKNAERTANLYIRNSTRRGGDGFRRFSSKTNGGSKNRVPPRKWRLFKAGKIDRVRASSDDLMIAAGVFDADADKPAPAAPKASTFQDVDRLYWGLTNWQRHQLDRSRRSKEAESVLVEFGQLSRRG